MWVGLCVVLLVSGVFCECFFLFFRGDWWGCSVFFFLVLGWGFFCWVLGVFCFFFFFVVSYIFFWQMFFLCPEAELVLAFVLGTFWFCVGRFCFLIFFWGFGLVGIGIIIYSAGLGKSEYHSQCIPRQFGIIPAPIPHSPCDDFNLLSPFSFQICLRARTFFLACLHRQHNHCHAMSPGV